MKIVVLVKQVPDMEKVKFDREKGTIDRKSAGTEINPYDLNALEVAFTIADSIGAHVTAVSMGPPSAMDALRDAIARGADSGILLSDKRFGGADVKATAKTLAGAVKKIENVDLVIAGLQTVDGDTGQVGSEVAHHLGIPNVCSVTKILQIDEDSLTVVTDMWDSSYVKNIKYPALITVTKEVNSPRLPSFKGKMNARKAEIPVWGQLEINEFAEVEDVGIKGSATWVKKIEVPELHVREGKVYRDNTAEGISHMTDMLFDSKVLEVSHE